MNFLSTHRSTAALARCLHCLRLLLLGTLMTLSARADLLRHLDANQNPEDHPCPVHGMNLIACRSR